MNLKAIQNLIKFVAKTGVQEVKLEMKDVKLTIKSGTDKIIRHQQIELPEPSILPEPKNDIKNEPEKVKNDKIYVEATPRLIDLPGQLVPNRLEPSAYCTKHFISY